MAGENEAIGLEWKCPMAQCARGHATKNRDNKYGAAADGGEPTRLDQKIEPSLNGGEPEMRVEGSDAQSLIAEHRDPHLKSFGPQR
jgi:hypothetical protein